MRDYEHSCAARKAAQLEASHVRASVDKYVRADLMVIYKHRQSIERQLLDSIQLYHATGYTPENFDNMIQLAVLEGINRDSKLLEAANFVLNAGASANDMYSSFIDNLQDISVHDASKALSTSDAEKLMLGILEATQEMSRKLKFSKSRALLDISKTVKKSKKRRFADLGAEFASVSQRVAAKLTRGHMTQEEADNLLLFVHFLERCINNEDEPIESYVDSEGTITTQEDEVEAASRRWILRREALQPISEQKHGEAGAEEPPKARGCHWEKMSDEEHELFEQGGYIKPVGKCDGKEEQDEVLKSCATHGLNPFAYNLRIPGKGILMVGAKVQHSRAFRQLDSFQARFKLMESDQEGGIKVNMSLLPVLWAGLQRAVNIINSIDNSRVLRELLQVEDSNHERVYHENFVKAMHSLMSNSTLLSKRFGTDNEQIKTCVADICERIRKVQPSEKGYRRSMYFSPK